MKTSAILGSLLFAVCGACAGAPKVPTPSATPMRVPRDATAIDFTLVSGRTPAVSMRSRSVAVGSADVVLAPSGFYGESTRSRAWWEETRSLLDDGLANATACEAPTPTCGFELRVTTPRGEEMLQGCCSERAAHNVEAAFRRLVPAR